MVYLKYTTSTGGAFENKASYGTMGNIQFTPFQTVTSSMNNYNTTIMFQYLAVKRAQGAAARTVIDPVKKKLNC